MLDFEIGTRFLDSLSLTQPSAEWVTGSLSLRPRVLMSNLSGTLTLMRVKSIPYFLYCSKAVVVRGMLLKQNSFLSDLSLIIANFK